MDPALSFETPHFLQSAERMTEAQMERMLSFPLVFVGTSGVSVGGGRLESEPAVGSPRSGIAPGRLSGGWGWQGLRVPAVSPRHRALSTVLPGLSPGAKVMTDSGSSFQTQTAHLTA